MNRESFQVSLKQKAIHEFKEFVGIFLYLAFFFCSVTTYKILLTKEFHDLYLDYSFVLINAFVFAKVILIGEYAHVGRRLETKSLVLSAVYKAFLFTAVVIGFHYLEEGTKRFLHGENIAGTFYEMGFDLLLARALVIFSTFVPFFGFRELRRVLGEEKFRNLFFTSRRATKSDLLADEGTPLTDRNTLKPAD
jgi:hypothetical protein